MNGLKAKSFRAVIMSLLLIAALLITACSQSSPEPAPVEEKIDPTVNPLTGATAEEGYSANSEEQRIVAFVVENSPEARPQWGMDDPEYSPDIVLQGEVEAGITRTLWMFADYNKLPEIIGPMRSARPPYIKFSELFDAVFIHWGQSGSKGNYVGASTVFKRDKVDHIDQMSFTDDTGLFDRESTRAVSMEHTGITYGAKVPAALDEAGCRKKPEDYTRLKFSKLGWAVSMKPAQQITVNYSEKASWEKTQWTYNSEDKKYHTSNFQNDFARDNLLILMDKTEYIDKDNYSGVIGQTITYCNYKLKGGKGYLISQGAVRDIKWKVRKGKLILIDTEFTEAAQERAEAEKAAEEAEATAEGTAESTDESQEAEEEKPVTVEASLFPGKTWIGWVSSNNGGSVEITAGESDGTAESAAEQ